MKGLKKTKQNLILFFEENNDFKDISSNLVRLYMNRSVIDEEDQSEISEIYSLYKRDQNPQIIEFYLEKGKFHLLHPTDTYLSNMHQSMDKLENDETTFKLSISKIIESERARLKNQKIQDGIKVTAQSDDQYINHFVIGTSFYINRSKPLQIFSKNIIKSYFQVAVSELEEAVTDSVEYSSMVTVLRGTATIFLTSEEV